MVQQGQNIQSIRVKRWLLWMGAMALVGGTLSARANLSSESVTMTMAPAIANEVPSMNEVPSQ